MKALEMPAAAAHALVDPNTRADVTVSLAALAMGVIVAGSAFALRVIH